MYIFGAGKKTEDFTMLQNINLYNLSIWLLRSNCSFKILCFWILRESKASTSETCCPPYQSLCLQWGGNSGGPWGTIVIASSQHPLFFILLIFGHCAYCKLGVSLSVFHLILLLTCIHTCGVIYLFSVALNHSTLSSWCVPVGISVCRQGRILILT